MNKKKIGLIVVVFVLIIGIVFFVNKSNQTTNIETGEVKKPTENSVKVDKIAGFNYEDKDEVGGFKLPYKVEKTDLLIQNIGQYTGQFIEDGSDKPVANVLSLLVKNDSKEVVQYAEINIKINGEKDAVFKVTNLPPKTSTLVMESTGKIEFNKGDEYKYVDSIQAKLDNMSLLEDKIKITKQEDGIIGIKNISGKDLGTVYVYYKYFQEGGAYLGGITYRVKFENVKARAKVEEKTSHFSKNSSEILMVDAY